MAVATKLTELQQQNLERALDQQKRTRELLVEVTGEREPVVPPTDIYQLIGAIAFGSIALGLGIGFAIWGLS